MQPMRLCICTGRQFEETVEKTYKCDHCDFTYVQSVNLRTHLKSHSGEKAYKCSQCDFAYIQAGNFRKHLKTPLGEKAYKCNQCDFVFFRADNLRRQLKKRTNATICNFASIHEGDLRKHLKTPSCEKSVKSQLTVLLPGTVLYIAYALLI